MKQEHFGKTPDGTPVELYKLSNRNGLEVAISTYGGAIVSLEVSDRRGNLADVVLGYDSCDGYVSDVAYLGPILGRHANRIAKGRFTLSGVTYSLARNNGEHHLHGGLKGLHKVVWKAGDVSTSNSQALELTYFSKDLEEGYPGNMSVRVVYNLNDANELKIEYFATSDKDTVVNLTNHAYFNLGGHDSGDILKHELMIHADRFTPTDASSIPTGEFRSVEGTPFDFRRPTAIGSRVGEIRGGEAFDFLQLLNTGHSGTLSTIHASSAKQGLARFTSCVLQSGVELPYRAIKTNIGDSLNVVVQIERRPGRRFVSEVIEINGYDPDTDQFDFGAIYLSPRDNP